MHVKGNLYLPVHQVPTLLGSPVVSSNTSLREAVTASKNSFAESTLSTRLTCTFLIGSNGQSYFVFLKKSITKKFQIQNKNISVEIRIGTYPHIIHKRYKDIWFFVDIDDHLEFPDKTVIEQLDDAILINRRRQENYLLSPVPQHFAFPSLRCHCLKFGPLILWHINLPR